MVRLHPEGVHHPGREWHRLRHAECRSLQKRAIQARISQDQSQGAVPALDHDGRIVIESSLICEYLDDTFPDPSLIPADPFLRDPLAATQLGKRDDAEHRRWA